VCECARVHIALHSIALHIHMHSCFAGVLSRQNNRAPLCFYSVREVVLPKFVTAV
jgi:hypothetical protein